MLDSVDEYHAYGDRGLDVVDHLVFFAARDEASPEDIEDLVSSIRGLRDVVPSVVDLSVGEDFTGRSGEYTHGIFVRFEDAAGLREYMEHPAHLAVVEKLNAHTTGLIAVGYEF